MTTRPGVSAAVALVTAVLVLAPAPLARAADPAPRLTDDAGGEPLFSSAVLSPGSARSACLTVTASGAATGDSVTLAATDVSGGLAPYLDVTIETGSGTTGTGRCTSFSGSTVYSGTLAALGAVTGDGVETGWKPAESANRAFRITVSLISDPAAMGQTATAAFAWRLVQGPVVTPTPTPTPTSTETTSPPEPTTPPTSDGPLPPVTTTTATAGAMPLPTGSAQARFSSSPSASPVVTRRPPKAEVTVPGLPGTPQSPSGGSGSALGGLAGKIGKKLGVVSRQAVDVVQGLARKPQYTFGPVLLAVLFLFLQHLVDLRDPKLAQAFRTQRDLMLEFPADYDRVEER